MLYKSCLSSFALVALALSPLAAASPLVAADLVERSSSSPNVVSGASLDKREARAAVAERAKQAKARAARKAKRAQDLASSPLGSRAMTTVAAVAAMNTKSCTAGPQQLHDFICQKYYNTYGPSIPNSEAAYCDTSTGMCTVSCAAGYYYTSSGCLKSSKTCGRGAALTVCPPNDIDGHGSYACSGNKCVLVCDSSLGYSLNNAKNYCYNFNTDPDHCGGEARANYCPGSYNSAGSRICTGGVCGIQCPKHFTLYQAKSRSNPDRYYCLPSKR